MLGYFDFVIFWPEKLCLTIDRGYIVQSSLTDSTDRFEIVDTFFHVF